MCISLKWRGFVVFFSNPVWLTDVWLTDVFCCCVTSLVDDPPPWLAWYCYIVFNPRVFLKCFANRDDSGILFFGRFHFHPPPPGSCRRAQRKNGHAGGSAALGAHVQGIRDVMEMMIGWIIQSFNISFKCGGVDGFSQVQPYFLFSQLYYIGIY